MKRLLVPLCLLLVVGAFAGPTKVSDIVKAPQRFDAKTLTTVGLVSNFKAKTSKIGNKYFVFDLKEGSSMISVYGRFTMKMNPSNGQRVLVTGKFEKEHKMKDFSIKNQITVADEKGVKILLK